MDRVPVKSSTIKAIGYDPHAITLEIEFNDGSVYQYFDVPTDVHIKFLQATSLGQFFGKQIRGHFRYLKL